ncbi:CDP-diacylglycerol--glycerol-3-phosphate 3-phosphatidyltransferase [Candidatus Bipolaricaulota bacterium]|nr:CDP-diacylglycerol--glycerol-3-phosphate 3-phosphatidyltransferase [Candidatus Bipolaricaulota bacterium]
MTDENLPNALTVFRILSVPFVMFLLLSGFNLAALALFLFASVTDLADGYLARKYDRTSPFGKFADPIADKLLVSAVFITFIQLGKLTAVPVVVIISREFLVTGLRLLGATVEKVISASWFGKTKTVSHIILIVAITINLEFQLVWLKMSIPWLIYLAIATAVASGVDYLVSNRKLIKECFLD